MSNQYETNAAYHADIGHVSNSMLSYFREFGPESYRLHYVARETTRETTRDMLIGSLTHSLVLEPDRTEEEFIVEPDWSEVIRKADGKKYASVLATSECRKQRAIFINSNKNKAVLTLPEWTLAENMATAVLDTPFIDGLLSGCLRREAVYRWDDMGISCKCRVDAKSEKIAIDLKTSRGPIHPDLWRRSARKWGYHRQAAWYLDGMAADGDPVERFIFIVVNKEPPHVCFACEEHPAWIQNGREDNSRTLSDLTRCHLTGTWRLGYQDFITQFPEGY